MRVFQLTSPGVGLAPENDYRCMSMKQQGCQGGNRTACGNQNQERVSAFSAFKGVYLTGDGITTAHGLQKHHRSIGFDKIQFGRKRYGRNTLSAEQPAGSKNYPSTYSVGEEGAKQEMDANHR